VVLVDFYRTLIKRFGIIVHNMGRAETCKVTGGNAEVSADAD